jgi:hypothetical protein
LVLSPTRVVFSFFAREFIDMIDAVYEKLDRDVQLYDPGGPFSTNFYNLRMFKFTSRDMFFIGLYVAFILCVSASRRCRFLSSVLNCFCMSPSQFWVRAM